MADYNDLLRHDPERLTVPECRPFYGNIYDGVVDMDIQGFHAIGGVVTEETDREWARKDGSTHFNDPLEQFLNNSPDNKETQ